MMPRHAADESLIARVVGHVLHAEARGELPRLAWHLGLSPVEREAMHARWPPECAAWDALEQATAPPDPQAARGHDLLAPLHALLMAHRADTDAPLIVLANALACACFGGHHLWQDLGATGRDEVSRLMAVCFPALFASNTRNLKWKRHLFLTLGEQLGRDDLRPPKCDDCDSYQGCFGSPVPSSTTVWPLTPAR